MKHNFYTFECSDGIFSVSKGLLTRLLQEGNIFRLLVHGGGGFCQVMDKPTIGFLKHYDISRKVFAALILSLRLNDAKIAYKYRHIIERIGGFKFIDRYHRKKQAPTTPPTPPTPTPPTPTPPLPSPLPLNAVNAVVSSPPAVFIDLTSDGFSDDEN